MSRQIRLLFGISVFWLALSVLFDGVNTLVLPLQVGALASQNNQATLLGLLTFVGLLAGVVGGALLSARLIKKLRGNGNRELYRSGNNINRIKNLLTSK